MDAERHLHRLRCVRLRDHGLGAHEVDACRSGDQSRRPRAGLRILTPGHVQRPQTRRVRVPSRARGGVWSMVGPRSDGPHVLGGAPAPGVEARRSLHPRTRGGRR